MASVEALDRSYIGAVRHSIRDRATAPREGVDLSAALSGDAMSSLAKYLAESGMAANAPLILRTKSVSYGGEHTVEAYVHSGNKELYIGKVVKSPTNSLTNAFNLSPRFFQLIDQASAARLEVALAKGIKDANDAYFSRVRIESIQDDPTNRLRRRVAGET